MNKVIFPFIIIISIFSACTDQVAIQEKGFHIEATLEGFEDSTLFYLKNLSNEEIIDSVYIKGSKVEFNGELADVPEMLWLYTNANGEFSYMTLLIGNERVSVNSSKDEMPWKMEANGSKTLSEALAWRDVTRAFDIKRDSLVNVYFGLEPEEQAERAGEIWGEIGLIDDSVETLKFTYLLDNVNSHSSLIELGYLKDDLSKDTVQMIFEKVSPELRSSKYGRVIEVYLAEKISAVGDQYHDFEASNEDGDTVLFSNMMDEGYILLDFTAAYCGPCVQSVGELAGIHQNNDSVTVVSFSGDAKKETWLYSLKRDSTTWASLWDGKGRYSETSIKYGVQGYPTFVLINPEGEIIDKWFGYGEGLIEQRLTKIQSKTDQEVG
ncbi:MAG: TlpA disulfide reductase family protein [Bacteroidota bacterium]